MRTPFLLVCRSRGNAQEISRYGGVFAHNDFFY